VFQDLNPAPFGKLHQKQTRYPLGHDRYGGSLGPGKFYPFYTLTPTLSHLQFLEYDGRKDPKDWLRAFNKYTIACDWSNDKRLNMAFVCLKG
jgi:hypothetical protein